MEEENTDYLDNLYEQRRFHPRRPKQISNVISRLMARKGYAQQLSTNELDGHWLAVVGKSLGKRSKVGLIKRGVLEVIVENSAVLQELTFQKKRILKKLIEKQPNLKVSSLRFKVGVIQ